MKKNFSFSALVLAIVALSATLLTSCIDYASQVEDSGVPISLEVVVNLKDIDLPEEALTAKSPVKVIGLRQECGCYTKVFVEDAYIDESGRVVFLNASHTWLSDRLMTFTVYWPAEATITTDCYGRITEGDCIVYGHSCPMNPILPRKDSSIQDYRFCLYPFDK